MKAVWVSLGLCFLFIKGAKAQQHNPFYMQGYVQMVPAVEAEQNATLHQFFSQDSFFERTQHMGRKGAHVGKVLKFSHVVANQVHDVFSGIVFYENETQWGVMDVLDHRLYLVNKEFLKNTQNAWIQLWAIASDIRRLFTEEAKEKIQSIFQSYVPPHSKAFELSVKARKIAHDFAMGLRPPILKLKSGGYSELWNGAYVRLKFKEDCHSDQWIEGEVFAVGLTPYQVYFEPHYREIYPLEDFNLSESMILKTAMDAKTFTYEELKKRMNQYNPNHLTSTIVQVDSMFLSKIHEPIVSIEQVNDYYDLSVQKRKSLNELTWQHFLKNVLGQEELKN